MRVLIIMEGFFPGKKYGGPPVSVHNFCSLMNEYECYIVTKNHDNGEMTPYADIKNGWNKRSNYEVMYVNDDNYNKAVFEKVICEINPDIIYLQGLFQECVLPCLWLAKKQKIKVFLAPRGELCEGAFRKKYKKIPYICVLYALGLLKNVQFQSTSAEETEAIHKYLHASYNKIHFLTNIPSLPLRQYPNDKKKANSARFVFLSRIHPKKNLIGAIRAFKDVDGEVSFDIYGPIEDRLYWEECKEAIMQLPSNIHVEYCGLVSHDEVHRVFSSYDAFLFPTFSENYGHVIVEALIVGCPIIISDQTPWTDVNEWGAGWAISLDDRDAFTKAIQQIIACDSDIYRIHAKQYIITKLDFEQICETYKNTFQQCIDSVD